jgi:hypothetical protein
MALVGRIRSDVEPTEWDVIDRSASSRNRTRCGLPRRGDINGAF